MLPSGAVVVLGRLDGGAVGQGARGGEHGGWGSRQAVHVTPQLVRDAGTHVNRVGAATLVQAGNQR